MGFARALVRACHPLPTVAVTAVIAAFAWSLGWRGGPFVVLVLAVLTGQLSVGWSNDAHDAELDVRAGRTGKPVVAATVSVRALWAVAVGALIVTSVLSWTVAGAVGGTFHVFSVAMAWLYNLRLSRTVLSWLPYALAFGAVPPFLTYGLDGSGPPPWSVAVFAIVGVSAHLANALPDLESDRSSGIGGLVVRLGAPRSELLCWSLLTVGTAILVSVTAAQRPAVATAALLALVAAAVWSWRSSAPSTTFRALLLVVGVDVVALVVAAGAT
jgi:4-hydroxybenzoate polyprenyltransferase